jgi:hypothetical protein
MRRRPDSIGAQARGRLRQGVRAQRTAGACGGARVLAAVVCRRYAPGEFERPEGGSQARSRGKWGAEGHDGTRWARAPTNLGDRRWIVDGEVDPGATATMAVDIFNPHANEPKLVPKSGYGWRIGGRGGSAGSDLGEWWPE